MSTMAGVGLGLGALGSIVGGIFSNKAGKVASKADSYAAQIEQQAGEKAQNNTQEMYRVGESQLNPYVTSGTQAFNSIGDLMQHGTQGQGPMASWNQNFTAPTAAQAEATPGFQFTMNEGTKALENSAAARGGILSAGTGKQLQQYGQGLASTTYGDTYNRAMQEYQQKYAQFNNNQSNLYNRLMGIGQTGLGAAESSASLGMNAANIYGNEGLTAAAGRAGYTAASGGAQAIGIQGLGNSIGNAMGAVGGGMMNMPTPQWGAPGTGTTPMGPGYGSNQMPSQLNGLQEPLKG